MVEPADAETTLSISDADHWGSLKCSLDTTAPLKWKEPVDAVLACYQDASLCRYSGHVKLGADNGAYLECLWDYMVQLGIPWYLGLDLEIADLPCFSYCHWTQIIGSKWNIIFYLNKQVEQAERLIVLDTVSHQSSSESVKSCKIGKLESFWLDIYSCYLHCCCHL